MSVSIVVPNVTFTKYFAQSLPKALNGATGYYLFGGTQADSIKNRALSPAVANATVVGTPTYDTGFSRIAAGGSHGFNTGLASGSIYTYVAVASIKGAAMIMGVWPYPGINAMAMTGSGLLYAANGSFNYTTQIPSANKNGFALYAMVVNETTVTLYVHDGTTLTSKTTNGVAQTSSTPVKIGVSGGSVGGSEIDFAASVVYNKALTLDEMTSVYKHFKSLMPSRGITMI